VKLCRFELVAEPGLARSGIVYGSKVYETDGANPVGVHEWVDVVLLAPVGQPPSVRLFGIAEEEMSWEMGPDMPVANFEYLNPAVLIGPSVALPKPDFTTTVRGQICLGVIIGGAGLNVPIDEADGLVLGLTLVTVLHSPADKGGRAKDVGYAVGPAITTPEELDDAVTVDERGRRYRFSVGLRLNSEEVERFDLSSLPHTVAEMISNASESARLVQGDLIAISLFSAEKLLDKGDEVQILCDKLGALTTRLV